MVTRVAFQRLRPRRIGFYKTSIAEKGCYMKFNEGVKFQLIKGWGLVRKGCRMFLMWSIWGVVLVMIQGSGLYNVQSEMPVIYQAGTAMVPLLEVLSKIALWVLALFGI